MQRFVIIALGVTASVVGPVEAGQEEWPQFRGTQAGVVAADPNLPDTWSETANVVWKVDVLGLGWSSPVIWGDHVFVTSAISAGEEPAPIKGLYDPGEENGSKGSSNEHRWMLYDIDFTTGQIRWQRELHSAPPPMKRHLKNSFASETPVTDGRRVHVYLGNIGLVGAFNMSGETVWMKEIEVYNTLIEMGTAASPVLHEDRLYIVNDNTTHSFMVAFDKNTGEELWRVDRDEQGQNWATPFVWENELRTELVTSGTQGVRSYDLDGGLLWEIHGMSGLTIPTPFASHGLLYLSSGYPGGGIRPVYAVRPGASGDISLWPEDAARSGITSGFPGPINSSDYIAWSYPLLGTYNTSALVYGDYYYTLLDRGFFVSHDAVTGQEVYGRQRLEIGNGFTASPWAYNGKIFLLSEDGDTYVVRAGSEFEILHKNSLNEMSLATPAVARGSLILRTQSKLYRIAQETNSATPAHQSRGATMTITRRKALSISGSTLAGLSLGVLRPERLQATQTAGQQDWPDELVERPLREGFPAPLPLNADGSAPEHPASAAGPITDPLMWRTEGRRTPEAEFDYRQMQIRVDTRGLARLTGTLRFSDLEQLPSVSHTFLLQCGAPNPRGIVKWTGVRFSDFADMLGVIPEVHYCRFIASDRFYADEPLTTLRHPQVMLAWLMNDEPIPPRHGAPLRLIVPFRYGNRSVKAITEMTFSTPGPRMPPLPV